MAKIDTDSVKPFIWSDNWWIEGAKAWFVDGMQNILFCLDLRTYICEMAIRIPASAFSKFKLTPHCMKYKENVFCMPDAGNSIWIYSTLGHNFTEIKVINPDRIRLGIHDFWEYKNRIFAVSIGLRQIIEINPDDKLIDNYYFICDDCITRSTKKDNSIYTLSNVLNVIYEFNLDTKKIKEFRLPSVGKKFSHICYDGKTFWLSGYCKEIYVWIREKNVIQIKDGFPLHFGTYSFKKSTNGEVDYQTEEYEFPTFLYIASVRESVWFIPFQTNQIIYYNREKGGFLEFEIEEEIETKESLLRREIFEAKYILEYIKDNRYIGLFSLKNNRILEIDTDSLKYRWYDFDLSDFCLHEYINIRKGTFQELYAFDKEIYAKIFRLNRYHRGDSKRNSIGKEIYNHTV